DGRTLEPFADLLRRLAQRGLLQRLERRETASVVLQLRTQPVEVLGGLLLLLSKLLDLLPDGVEQACGLGALGLQRLLLRRQLIEPRLELLEAKRVAFRRLPLLLACKAISLRGELLEPRFLDLRGALHVRDIAGDLLPAAAPVLHRRLRLLQRLLGRGAREVGLLEARVQLLERELELLELELIVLDVRADFLEL